MNIAFDSVAQLGPMSKNRGIGNYADSQFRTLLKMDGENRYFFFNVFEDSDVFWEEERAGQIKETDFLCIKGREFLNADGFREFYGELIKSYLRKNKIDVFYITSPFDGHLPPYKKEWFNGVKTVATVYDIIPYVMKSHYFPGKHEIDWYMERIDMLRWVDRLLVISQSVKDDLVNYLNFNPDKIDVIWGAPSDMFKEIDVSKEDEDSLRKRYHIDGDFVMCTGGDDERKNLAGLIEAFSMLPKPLLDRFQLVIVCKLQQVSVERYTALAKEKGIGDRLVLTNFVTDEELVQLYNLANLVVFPSVYEGFGLPVVEAWACGTGVVTSNNSSLRQIAGDAAVLVDPHSIKDIARGMEEALEGDLEVLARKGKARLELFTWEKVASLTQASLERVFSKDDTEKKQMKSPKYKIAFFTPLPPLQSGISDYSTDMITALADYFDIDIYVDKGYTPEVTLPDNTSIFPYKSYEGNRKLYRETVFQMGNSNYHEYMWPYIRKWGGLVVLHDYNMHGVVQSKTLFNQHNEKEYRELIMEDLTDAECQACMNAVGNSQAMDSVRIQYEINGFITNHADKIIVHSDEAKEKLLRRDISRDVKRIRHYARIEPLEEAKKAKEKLGIPERCILFAAFGHVHETKRVIPILRAFARLSREEPDAMLLFGGKMDSNLEKDFEKAVTELQLEDKIKVTGYLDLDAFLDYMNATDICLNLRWPYNGETSGSLMRMLAKGKCIMVNNMGSFSEVPDDCCVKLPSVEHMTERQEISTIYEEMLKLCEDTDLRLGISANAREYAERELDVNIIAEQYRDYILVEKENVVTEKMINTLRGEIARLGLNQQEVVRLARTLAYVKLA